MSSTRAAALGLTPLARFVGYATAGVAPELFGIGPVPAIRKALARTGLTLDANPLGCTGARLTTTLLHELRRRQSRYGLVSMCVGGGMGAAGIFERMS